MPTSVEMHKQVVQKFLDSKAVDFTAIGRTIGEIGPSVALSDIDGDFFCGTMRTFIRVYRIVNPMTPVEDLEALRGATSEL